MSAAATTPPAAIPMAAPARSSRRETLTRLLRSPTFLIAVVVIALLDVLRVLRLPHRSARPDLPDDDILQSPNGKYPFGTDQIGRDVLSRVIAGLAQHDG